MDLQKNTRRKRKDYQSRDFTCRCGKSYLSYAAAYTHVKNKHNLEKQYLDDIGKPERQKLPRGRPKEKKQEHCTTEIQQLSIIEETILKIYTKLQDKFDKIILEGNSKQKSSQIELFFLGLLPNKSDLDQKLSGQIQRFLNDLTKHFSCQIAAKIRLALTIISTLMRQQPQSQQIQKRILGELSSHNLWRGQNEINRIIYEGFTKWQKVGGV